MISNDNVTLVQTEREREQWPEERKINDKMLYASGNKF